jgi:hypothetical protein
MASVFLKGKGRKVFWMEFRDQYGQLRRASTKLLDQGTKESRQRAENLAKKVEDDAARLRAGDPLKDKDLTGVYLGLATLGPGRVKWEEACSQYLGELARRGSPPGSKQHRDVRVHLAAWGKAGSWKTLADVRTPAISAFLAQLHAEGRTPRTQNHYLAHLRQMLGWCVKPQHWLMANPAQEVDSVKVGAAGRRRKRRAYTPEEWQRLLAAAPEHRRAVYQVAAYSGLRRSELKRLQKQDCDPRGPKPRWKIRAEVTKNGVEAKLPMLPDCAAVLLPIWEALP